MLIEKGKWTLFLDRDGVINERLPQQYVCSRDQFHFLPGIPESFPLLTPIFNRIIIVTNQQGIGKGLMTISQLEVIHNFMRSSIRKMGGTIDGIYYCGHKTDEVPNHRKPSPYMAYQAKKDFPEIDFKRSIMVGDQDSDIEFGLNTGMKTVWIPDNPRSSWNRMDFSPDYIFPDLLSFAKAIRYE